MTRVLKTTFLGCAPGRRRYPNAMQKFTLRSIAIFLPLCVAAICAVWTAHLRSKRTAAREAFSHAVESESLLPIGQAEARLADSEVKQMLIKAAVSDLIVFDGESRVAQIQPNMLKFGERSLDGLSLHTIGDGTGSMTYQLPIGTRIRSVSFEGDALAVTVYGDLEIRGKILSISEQNAEVHKIKWKRGDKPPVNMLDSSIANRSRKN
ncbi:hypothetical protein FYK55_27550 [Roseiconus nitratireducens]|uniref:Uncharacterized protein n=1 Tax=Roseiconus nitratireducens TaxID=2605748 RepID=A0A5M6CYX6_9BACT|nr:hypothetical protein [Roseiconus nitratireducens]KAA5538499.1 hypothetical protein FYK55_27550 [Roseiconus nitratireducens]